MKRSQTFVVFFALLAVIVGTLPYSVSAVQTGTPVADPCQVPATPVPDHDMGSMDMSVDFDLMFIDMMIVHHESAVLMAEVALERAETPEVIGLSEEIIAAQSSEIAQMQEWREAWYPGAPVMSMDAMSESMAGMMADDGMAGMGHMDATPMAGMMDDSGMMGMDPAAEVVALCAVEGPVDVAFLEAMIPHHESAIVMARVAQTEATHQEIRDLADAIISTQQAEIDQMNAWLMEWETATPVSG